LEYGLVIGHFIATRFVNAIYVFVSELLIKQLRVFMMKLPYTLWGVQVRTGSQITADL